MKQNKTIGSFGSKHLKHKTTTPTATIATALTEKRNNHTTFKHCREKHKNEVLQMRSFCI